jgi:hypothetical protein
MPKTQSKKTVPRSLKSLRFNETWLVVFAIIFGTIGSYGWLRTFAAPEDAGFIAQDNISAEEQAWFSSITGASAIILATGPIAALLVWWIWRRSGMELWAKLMLTVVPVMMVVAFT